MNPTRQSSDPNAPYRTAIQWLADGYGYVPHDAENLGASSSTLPTDRQLEELSTIGAPSSTNTSDPAATLCQIRQLFRAHQIDYRGHAGCSDKTILRRMENVNLSLNTLLNTLIIANTPDHPLKNLLGVTPEVNRYIILELAGVTTSRGWPNSSLLIINQANNDPEQLYAKIYSVFRR